MANNFARGTYAVVNREKYIGVRMPIYRSSWEFSFCRFCDTSTSIQKWASEAVRIPYKDPLTNRNTVYVPDFFIQYLDKNNKIQVDLIEIKPSSQQLLEKVGKSIHNQRQFVKNQAKWKAAAAYCKQQGVTFRVLNETDIFHNGKGK